MLRYGGDVNPGGAVTNRSRRIERVLLPLGLTPEQVSQASDERHCLTLCCTGPELVPEVNAGGPATSRRS